MMRPTLEEQIRLSKMTTEELVNLFLPHGFWETLDFWLYNHCLLFWRVYRWNWFNVWTGEKGFILFAKHIFREWGKPAKEKVIQTNLVDLLKTKGEAQNKSEPPLPSDEEIEDVPPFIRCPGGYRGGPPK